MQRQIFTILTNRQIARDVFEMVLSGDTSAISAPGQFVNIDIEGLFLRRPISICDWEDGNMTLIYKVVGKGTGKMSAMQTGENLDILCPLGNGYDMEKGGSRPLLIGGGVGVPPLYGLCRRLVSAGKKPEVILGFNSACDMFYKEQFEALGVKVHIATADGSYGKKGFVTDAMDGIEYDCFFTCGPEPMLKAVYDKTSCTGQLSFEERMACGFGACMGCSCETKYGAKRICKDGPVLSKEEVIW